MKKKILAALLCVCMVVMMLPALVLADDEEDPQITVKGGKYIAGDYMAWSWRDQPIDTAEAGFGGNPADHLYELSVGDSLEIVYEDAEGTENFNLRLVYDGCWICDASTAMSHFSDTSPDELESLSTPIDDSCVSVAGTTVTAVKPGYAVIRADNIISDGEYTTGGLLSDIIIIKVTGDSPEILTGTDSSHTIGSGDTVTIHCSGELSDFVAVYVDGDVVDEANYTLEEGSTLLTFTSAYLDTLSVGEHVVTLEYTTGSVDVTLTIAEKSAEKDSVPKTGASDFAWLLLGIAVLAGAGVCVSSRGKRSE